MIGSEIQIRGTRARQRHCTRPRVWVGPTHIIEKIDQQILVDMAKTHTKPKPGKGYRDPEEVKVAVRAARVSNTSASWKHVQKLRKQARKQWEQRRIHEALSGDWEQVRKLRTTRNVGWDVHYAENQPEGEAHQSIHEHLQGIYETGVKLPELEPWTGEARAFTEQELLDAISAGHRGKAVGPDRTSHELLQGICNAPGGLGHLLEFYNGILCTAQIPSDWNRAIMVVIPKVAYPESPGELRPLAMGSAAAKVCCRMLLTRSEPLISLVALNNAVGKDGSAATSCLW